MFPHTGGAYAVMLVKNNEKIILIFFYYLKKITLQYFFKTLIFVFSILSDENFISDAISLVLVSLIISSEIELVSTNFQRFM